MQGTVFAKSVATVIDSNVQPNLESDTHDVVKHVLAVQYKLEKRTADERTSSTSPRRPYPPSAAR